jgi:hypothetical protein
VKHARARLAAPPTEAALTEDRLMDRIIAAQAAVGP